MMTRPSPETTDSTGKVSYCSCRTLRLNDLEESKGMLAIASELYQRFRRTELASVVFSITKRYNIKLAIDLAMPCTNKQLPKVNLNDFSLESSLANSWTHGSHACCPGD
jgi:hypothetical protein